MAGEQPTPSEAILAALGLSPEEYQAAREKARQARLEQVKSSRAAGERMWDEVHNPTWGGSFLRLGQDTLALNIPQPLSVSSPRGLKEEAVLSTLEKAYNATSVDELKETLRHTSSEIDFSEAHLRIGAAMEGYGMMALTRGTAQDWPGGVRALNSASDKGILNNQEVLNFIKDHSTTEQRAIIAEEIQKLMDAQSAAAPAAPPSSQPPAA